MAEKETKPLESKCHQTRTCLKYVYFCSCFQQFCPQKAKTGAELSKCGKSCQHGYCFSSLCQFGHYLLHAYVYSGMYVSVWCLEKNPVKCMCSVECTNTGAQCSHTQLQSLSCQMLSSHTTHQILHAVF